MSNKDFYRAFEEKYYAPMEVITRLRRQYLPFIDPLKKIYQGSNTYDMGCGRGEWLDLMKLNGFIPYGVDLDEGMLKACYERSLNVSKGDAVEYIKTLDSNSQSVVTAFHVVEHISFENLQIFVQEALRVLMPGGILIMETPNPENIKVATENFYLDPTHLKPIPSKLLSFLTEFYGYSRTKIVRLQEAKTLHNKKNIDLREVLEGVSPDYAVIAQKNASEEILSLFDNEFNRELGLSLNDLTIKFEARFINLEERTTQALERAIQAETKATQAEEKAAQAETKATQAEEKASQAETKATQTEINYHSLLNSNSWKWTKPLRLMGKFARWFKTGTYHWMTFSPTSRPRRVLKKTLISVKHYINTKPMLKMKLLNILNNFPSLKNRLKKIGNATYHTPLITDINTDTTLVQLSPQAQKIYNDLQKAITIAKGNK